jgi:molybdopterin-containing oxidoreductase family iron-sulfur binding subunit
MKTIPPPCPEPEGGRKYWRSLDQLAETPEFRQWLEREFPDGASEFVDPVSRRNFVKLMSASFVLGGFGMIGTGCRRPEEKILPFGKAPENYIHGVPQLYATAMPTRGGAVPLLVRSNDGHPTKIEGNPEHPASLGATDAFAQASVLTLYDPDRSQTLTHLGEIRPWAAFLGAARAALETQRLRQGAGLRVLTETVTSPTLADPLQGLLRALPAAKWHQYEPAGLDSARAGARMAFGEDINTIYHFEKAEVILALDSDFLSCGPGHLRHARAFADQRRIEGGRHTMNRLYSVESTLSNTGAKADHRLPLRASQIENFARTIAAELGIPVNKPVSGPRPPASDPRWITAIVRDLQQHRGSSLVIAGDQQSPMVHMLAHAMNHALGNVGQTVVYTEPVEANPVDQMASLRELAQDMEAGLVETLLILGGNPVYTAPADLRFGERLSKVGLRIHLNLYHDETSELCHWHIPEAHFLESWSDARAYDGIVTIIQPLIAPLYLGKTAHEVLAAFTDQPERSSYQIVRDYWKRRGMGAEKGRGPRAEGRGQKATSAGNLPSATSPSLSDEFERAWRKALHDGVVPNTALPPKQVSLKPDAFSSPRPSALGPQPSLEIVFRPDPTVFDGRFANNGWLQELPKPLTRLTWDNAALISPATAQRLGLTYNIAGRGGEHGQILADMVELRYQGRTVRAPVWIQPGQPDDCVTVHFGYGRWRAGHVGTGAGFNTYAIRTSDAPWFGQGLEIRKEGKQYSLACVDFHHNMAGRDLVRSGTLEEYLKHPEFSKPPEPDKTFSLYPGFEYKGYAWGMSVDLNACVGCGACVVACQAENNIPVVGKTEVLHGREMHWLRIDRYYKGTLDNPQAFFQPVLCMQCENAPCELVCPVAATAHSAEGLNDMVYNRCVGTRYCSNNCPYKVRRFNFFLYQDWNTPSLTLLHNPNVTVRSRGVMEKCTYCVQRINHAKIEAEKQGRPVRDGEIVTACQAVCPAGVFVFGNINDPTSRVARLKAEPRNYGLLAELNTQPRTTYLAALRNPNPELSKRMKDEG